MIKLSSADKMDIRKWGRARELNAEWMVYATFRKDFLNLIAIQMPTAIQKSTDPQIYRAKNLKKIEIKKSHRPIDTYIQNIDVTYNILYVTSMIQNRRSTNQEIQGSRDQQIWRSREPEV